MKKVAEEKGRAIYQWDTTKGVDTLAYIPKEHVEKFLKWCEEVGYTNMEEAK